MDRRNGFSECTRKEIHKIEETVSASTYSTLPGEKESVAISKTLLRRASGSTLSELQTGNLPISIKMAFSAIATSTTEMRHTEHVIRSLHLLSRPQMGPRLFGSEQPRWRAFSRAQSRTCKSGIESLHPPKSLPCTRAPSRRMG